MTDIVSCSIRPMAVRQGNSKVREIPLTGGGKVYPAFPYACRLLLPTAGFLNRDFDLLPLAFPGHLSGLRRKGLCLVQRKVQIEIVILFYISTQYLRLLQTDECARSEKHKGSGLEKHKGGGPWEKTQSRRCFFRNHEVHERRCPFERS